MGAELRDTLTGLVFDAEGLEAGGMTYRPPPRKPPLAQRIKAHQEKLRAEAEQERKLCQATTKKGLPCEAYATESGYCVGHERARAK